MQVFSPIFHSVLLSSSQIPSIKLNRRDTSVLVSIFNALLFLNIPVQGIGPPSFFTLSGSLSLVPGANGFITVRGVKSFPSKLLVPPFFIFSILFDLLYIFCRLEDLFLRLGSRWLCFRTYFSRTNAYVNGSEPVVSARAKSSINPVLFPFFTRSYFGNTK